MPSPTPSRRPTIVLALAPFSERPAACVSIDGVPLACAAEDQFGVMGELPLAAASWCLESVGADLAQVEHVVFVRAAKRRQSIRRARSAEKAGAQRGQRAAQRRQRQRQLELLRAHFGIHSAAWRPRLHSIEPQRALLAAAFFTSPFDRKPFETPSRALDSSATGAAAHAAVACFDSALRPLGSAWASAGAGRLLALGRTVAPHSLGLASGVFAKLLDSAPGAGEGGLRTLAAGGEPRYSKSLSSLIRPHGSRGFRLAKRLFAQPAVGLEALFADAEPLPDLRSEAVRRDLAASFQSLLDSTATDLLRELRRATNERTLCAVAAPEDPGLVLRAARAAGFDEPWLAPNFGAAALGAALSIWREVLGRGRTFEQFDPSIGYSTWKPVDLASARYHARHFETDSANGDAAAEALADTLRAGGVVGWCRGRSIATQASTAMTLLCDPHSESAIERARELLPSTARRTGLVLHVTESAADALLLRPSEIATAERLLDVKCDRRRALRAALRDGRRQAIARATGASDSLGLDLLAALGRRADGDAAAEVVATLSADGAPMQPAAWIEALEAGRIDALAIDGALLLGRDLESAPNLLPGSQRSNVDR